MSSNQLHHFYASLAPWFALSLLFLGRNPHPSRLRSALSLLIAAGILLIPLEHFSLVRWIALLESNPSITLTLLLAIALIARVGGPRLFRSQDWRAAWLVGSMAALVLYPSALGLSPFDSYIWGWGPLLAIATAAITVVLLVIGNRFAYVLVLVLLGMIFHPMESTNDWDCLIDACYGIFSLIATILIVISYKISTGHSGNARRKALP